LKRDNFKGKCKFSREIIANFFHFFDLKGSKNHDRKNKLTFLTEEINVTRKGKEI